MTVLGYIRQFFPDESDAFIEHILWGETGFPCFWNIPQDGDTSYEVFSLQVARAAARENFGQFGYLSAEQQLEQYRQRTAPQPCAPDSDPIPLT